MATADGAFLKPTGSDLRQEARETRPGASGDGIGSGGTQPPEKQKLFADRDRVYSRSIQGKWRKVKWWTLAVLLGLYYIGPWLRWDRGLGAPNQALLIDMPGRRAYFFGLEIWPQEIYYLTGVLILGALGLFFVTALFGRVWCGFTCPQTLWTDLFMWVERKIEGDRNARMKLDKGPLTGAKVGKKFAKHGAWLLIALATGGAWIMYFNNAPTVVHDFFTGQATTAIYGFVFLFTATTYVLAGWAREQVCIYMCPWPRFQGAMFDEDSLVVTYEDWRGEPRGGARKGQSFEGRGHCVDCGLCWQVCPTGVDIRKGQQMACIGCALCVDACNSVMNRFGLPPELITYDSISNQLARADGRTKTRFRLVRPRTIAYAVLLLLIATVMVVSLSTRSRLHVNVLQDRQPLYVKLSDGSIRNGYTIKVVNMVREPKTYLLSTDGLTGAEIAVLGRHLEPGPYVELDVAPDDVSSFRVFVKAPMSSLDSVQTDFTFYLIDLATRESETVRGIFNGPAAVAANAANARRGGDGG
ncbi:MAG: cytochrome c oxidase accessory protein CcoG [Rhodospirillales bacterium]|nr:cytochrome c oxidase accessory protein CcoG [Rhodospirillales bacterium]